MAAQSVVYRQRGRRRTSILLEESLALVANLTDNLKHDGKIKLDLSLGTLLNGVITSHSIATMCLFVMAAGTDPR